MVVFSRALFAAALTPVAAASGCRREAGGRCLALGEEDGYTSLLQTRRSATEAREASTLQQPVTVASSQAGSASPPRSIFLTLTFPTDQLPLELMLPHQVRGMTQLPNRSLDIVVVDNRPPGYGPAPADPFLESLAAEDGPHRRVVHPDEAHLDDPVFLNRFFHFVDAEHPEDITVRKAAEHGGDHEISNFLGMLTAISHCLDAEDSIEVCLYLDADIFIWRRPGGPGMLDLAPAVFRENPSLVVLEPPLLCEKTDVGMDANGVCKQAPGTLGVSQRHMMLHRERLRSILPLDVHWNETHGNFWGTWEKIMSNKLNETNGSGDMECGYDTVVTHPSMDRGEFGWMTREQHIEELAKFGTDVPSIPGYNDTYVRGCSVLIDRFEAGKFETELSYREIHGFGPYTRMCMSMRPSKERIDAGLAY